ncbi:MAG: sugar phosphate isomerase/epimerase [Erysipelotrichaceae bacterium]|nr:sugar phosphate isomerase/epimerase [Erysipelotrichaceae bacterium]
MKLSISNIAWEDAHNEELYKALQKYGYTGLEIAPTRFFPVDPYEHIEEIRELIGKLREEYGLFISSMQSIWYGRTENIFDKEEQKVLIDYTEKAVAFAEAAGCENLVFGCPKNRILKEGDDPSLAVSFFRAIAKLAEAHHTVIALEANPPIYGTNFINDTPSALSLIREVDHPAFRLNLDLGTMIHNGEDTSVLSEYPELIHHVHVSEPYLKAIEKRDLHPKMASFLRDVGYTGYVSIETGKTEDIRKLKETMRYVKKVFGDDE